MPSGRRCESPAMRGYAFCYHHARRAPVHKGSPAETRIQIPAKLDRAGIAQALHQIMNALGNNHISARRASILLCGLQMAGSNSENPGPAPPAIDLGRPDLDRPDLDRLFSDIGDLLSEMNVGKPQPADGIPSA